MSSLAFGDRVALTIQNLVAQVCLPITYLGCFVWMRFFRGYRILGLRDFRKRLLPLVTKKRGPLLICSNHLTLIDSLILMWALSPAWKAYFNSSLFPWNTPEKKNFSRTPLLKVFIYLGKCLPVVRQGPQAETKKLMDRLKRLFTKKQSVMIFPEGGRSRTGRVDTENFTYGVGRILEESRQEGFSPKVLCVYLRGENQMTFSNLPRKNERFHVDFQLLDPQSNSTGLRASRDYSAQIVEALAKIEVGYFAQIPHVG